jgi:chromate transporter
MKGEAMPQRTVGPAEITRVFLKIGAMSYGGPPMIQEEHQWIAKQDFVEGLALVNMLPGPGATQLGIFLGHAIGCGLCRCGAVLFPPERHSLR